MKKERLQDRTSALGLEAVRTVPTPAGRLSVVGGHSLDTQASLDSMPLGEGMELCIERDNEIVGGCLRDRVTALASLAQAAARQNREMSRLITADRSFTALPLPGRDNTLLAVLPAGNSPPVLRRLSTLI